MKWKNVKWNGMKWTHESVWNGNNIFVKTFKKIKNDLKHVFGKMLESSMIAVCGLVCAR